MVDNGSIWPRVCSMVGDRLPGDLSLTPGVTWLTGRLALGTIRDRLGRFQFWYEATTHVLTTMPGINITASTFVLKLHFFLVFHKRQ